MKILNMLFIKNTNIDKSLFSTLFFSFDNISFLGFDMKLLSYLKKYDDYEIKNERITKIGERHIEYKYIIKTIDNDYFIRYLSDDRNLIYDILIYTINDYDKIINIFFPKIEQIPDSLKKLNKPILKIDKNVFLIYKHNDFTKYLGYEDWDYKNKCLNKIDFSAIDNNFINYFNQNDFNNIFKFMTNSGNIISLYLDIKYIGGYYIIDNIILK